MKKLMTLIGAAAMALGLYAVDPDETEIFFESGEPGVPGVIPGALDLTATNALGYTLWWANDTNDIAATVTAYDPVIQGNLNYLALETGTDPLFRTAAAVAGVGETPTPQQVAVGEGVVFEQRVKFSAFDSAPTDLAADTKIAVWLKAVDAEDGTPETNLYVSTAILGSLLTVTQQTNLVLRGVSVEPDSWHTLKISTIKAFDLEEQGIVPGFIVSIDNRVLSVDDALFPADPLFGAASPASGVAAKFIAERKLMPSRISYNAGSGNPQTLIGAGYQGSGAIDSILVSAGNPYEVTVDITNLTHATIASVESTNGYAVVDNGDGSWTIAEGDAVRVTFAAQAGWTVSPTSKVFANVTTDTEFDFSDITQTEDAPTTYPVQFFTNDVAGTGYALYVVSNDVESGSVVVAPDAPVAPTGKSFAGWFETNGVGQVVAEPFDFDTPITAALDLFAQFTNNVYTLTLTPGENATLTASPAGPYTYGDKVTLTAAPVSSEYEFTSIPSGWYQDGDSLTNLVTISESTSITGPNAVKKAPVVTTYYIDITTNATVTYVAKFDNGDAVTFVNDRATVEAGTNVTIIATAVAGYTFATEPTGWRGTGSSVTNVISSIAANASVTLPTATVAGGWDPNPDAGKTAAQEYPALAGTALESANAKQLTDWAVAKGVAFNDVKDHAGDYVEAFLLNCSTSEVAAEKAAFKATITIDGSTISVTPPADRTYNGTLQLKGSTDLSTWNNVEGASSTYQFYKYDLSL